MSEFTAKLGDSAVCLTRLEELLEARARGLLAYDITSVSAYSELKGWGDRSRNRDGKNPKQMNIGLMTNRRTVLVMFEMYPVPVAAIRSRVLCPRQTEDLQPWVAAC